MNAEPLASHMVGRWSQETLQQSQVQAGRCQDLSGQGSAKPPWSLQDVGKQEEEKPGSSGAKVRYKAKTSARVRSTRQVNTKRQNGLERASDLGWHQTHPHPPSHPTCLWLKYLGLQRSRMETPGRETGWAPR